MNLENFENYIEKMILARGYISCFTGYEKQYIQK